MTLCGLQNSNAEQRCSLSEFQGMSVRWNCSVQWRRKVPTNFHMWGICRHVGGDLYLLTISLSLLRALGGCLGILGYFSRAAQNPQTKTHYESWTNKIHFEPRVRFTNLYRLIPGGNNLSKKVAPNEATLQTGVGKEGLLTATQGTGWLKRQDTFQKFSWPGPVSMDKCFSRSTSFI